MFIDAAVRDRATLLDGLEADATAYVLDPTRDGLQQIAAVLARHQNLQAVSIFAHGMPGRVALGSGCLDQEGLRQHEASLRSIGRAIAPGGVLQLAACEAGRGHEGRGLIQALSQQVGRAVAASSQRLGGDEGGGNWTLDVEAAPGAFASALPIAAAVLQSYPHALSGAAAPPAGFPLDIKDFSAPAAGGGSFVDGGSARVSGTALQLTPNANGASGIAVYNQSFSSALGLSFQFTYDSSGGSGADGISFFLLNGDTVASASSVTAGGFGGGLGYSNNNSGGTGGITGGFLGVGFDTYGNYAQTDHGQSSSGIAGNTDNYIGVRGAYNAATPYGWIAGVPYSPRIDGTRNVQVNVQKIDATHEQLQVYMEPSGNSTYTKVIDTTVNQALPSKFYFGFAASTGGSTDLHLIDAVSVKLPTSLTFGTATVQDVTTTQVNPATLNPGDTFTYTYTLTNNGPNDDGQITVNDLLPANVTGATWTVQDSSGTHSGIGPAIAANLVNGAAATITVTGRVDPNSTSGNADHTVTVSPGTAYSLVNPNEATGVTLNIGHGGSSVSLVGANQAVTTTDAAAVAPFAGASVVDTYATPGTGAAPVDTMTVRVAPGAGTLSGTGATYNASTGTLTASGTAAQLQTVLRSIAFTPTAHSMVPGSTTPVSISVTVTDSANQTGGASATAFQAATAMVTATHDTPAITGASANQAVNDNATAAPFSGMVVTDPDLTGATLAVTVMNGSVNGSFTAASSAGWSRSTAPDGDLTYTLMLGTQPNIGAAAQAALRSLVFQPASLTSLRGGTETVGFTVSVTDTATPAAGATDTNSSVLVRDVTPPTAPTTLALAPVSDTGVLGDRITSVALPTLTGTAEPGSTVKLYDGATLIGTGTADPATGAWSITATTPLTAGLNALTATSTDAAGNTSAPSSPLAVTLDTLAPAAPTLALAPASDTGVLGDRITSATTPAITGTGIAGDTITLRDGLGAVGSAVVASNGTWSVTTSTLVNGLHNLTATQTSPAGNVSPPSAILPLTIDTLAPAAPAALLLAPASDTGVLGDRVTSVALPTLTGTAEPGSTVKLYDGATLIGTGTADPATGAWSITATTPLTAGLNALTATSTDAAGDAAGNTSAASGALAVTLDTTAPVVTAALARDTGTSATDQVTADPTLTGAGDPGAIVTLTEGGTALGTATADASGAWSFTPALADGAHTVVASETDAAGNTGTATTSLTLDTKPPAITRVATSPNTGTVIVGQSVTLTLTTSEGVTVAGGTPKLTLNNGGTAAYDPTASTPTNLVFVYTVAPGQDTAALSVTGLNLAGATITDAAGSPANLIGAAASPIGVPQVNTGFNPFTPLVASNPDPAAILTVSAAVRPAIGGTYGNLGTGSIGADGATYTVTGTTAQVNTALAGVVLSPARDSPTLAGLTATVSDANGSQASQLSNTGALGSDLTAIAPGKVVTAGLGPDTLTGGASGTLLVGGAGNNILIGNVGGSTMFGGTGNSEFFGRGGSTLIVGGAMRDTISAGAGSETVISAVGGTALIGLGSGPALVNGRGADTIIGGSGDAVISTRNNSLVGLTAGSATVSAADGSTVLTGSGAALVAASGAGILMFQGSGAATFIGGSGSSTVVGGTGGHGAFFGGVGGGLFSGGSGGSNVMVGGQQATTLFGGGDGDVMFALGSAGTVMVAGLGNETLQGGYSSGNDTVFAGPGNDLIGLGSGQNVVFAGSGSATIIGGAGRDLLAFANGRAGGTDTLYNFKSGTDVVSLQGYGAGEAAHAMASANTIAGTATQAASTTVTLSDNTRITFQGITSLSASNFA